MLKPAFRALLCVLVPGVCASQTPSLDPAAATQMVRAAGMPLHDGAFAPGMLTVRVVEGAFTRNYPDQLVEVEVASGKTDSARTGPDGRAQFAHLPVGARVRAWATVGGERLESDSFEMPAESGVRVLLVVGAGASAPLSGTGASAASAWSAGTTPAMPPNHPPLPEASVSLPSVPASNTEGVTAVRAALLTATIFAFGIVLFRRPRR